MYEDKTYYQLLADMTSEVGDDVQKGAGSLVFNSLSVLAYELEKLYIHLNYVKNQGHADTADIEHLSEIAADRNVFRRMATHAFVRGVFNVEVPIGARFNLKGFNYKVSEHLSGYEYSLEVEETGAGANSLTGELTPITYVEGLENARVTELLIAGSEDENRESLYKRYIDSFKEQAFDGNITAYKMAATATAGVGGCKVYRAAAGPGTVKLVVISSDSGTVSEYLLNQIRKAAVPDEGSGYGWAPLDHVVTIESVKAVPVTVSTKITYRSGYSADMLGATIKDKISQYIKSIAAEWASGTENDKSIVYISRLEAAVLDVHGVLDISYTTLNGAPENLTIESDSIPTAGEVTLT